MTQSHKRSISRSSSPLTCTSCGDLLGASGIASSLCAACRGTDRPSLFDPPAQRHSPTSVEAAEAIKPSAGTLRERVYRLIVSDGPITDAEIQARTGMDGSTERPRRVELLRANLIRQAGTSVLPSGRKAATWVAA